MATVPALERPALLAVWLRAIRVYSFPASVVPVAAGAATAALAGGFSLSAFLLALLGCVALQAGSNLVNEYFDWRQGADHEASLGPAHVIHLGWLAPNAVLAAALGSLALGSVVGLVLVAQVGWPILGLGLVGVLLAWGYTAPPFKLAYRGLGEIAVFLAFGPLMVAGSYLVHQPAAEAPGLFTALAASVPIGLLVAAILHANNVRDLDDDRRLGKRTLATVFGHGGSRVEFDVLLGGAYGLVVLLVLVGWLPWPALLALASAPWAWRVRQLVARNFDPKVLLPAVKLTAAVHMRYGLLLAAGLALAVWLPGVG